MKTTYTLLVTGLATQQAAATWDLFASPFLKTPKYNNNECSDKQKGGFSWTDLKEGEKDFTYGDFNFSGGWSCTTSLGKRDALTRRSFGSKMIKNIVTKDKPASFSCDQRKSGFSVTEIDVSVEFDIDLELHYKMEDGSTCKQYSSCSQGGTTLKNTQCGGAKTVDVYLGSHYKGEQSSCEIGLHHIGFDCDEGTKYVPPSPPSPPSPPTGGNCQGEGCPPSTPEASTPSAAQSTPPSYPTGGNCQGEGCPPSTPEASTSSAANKPTPPVAETPATPACGQNGGPACPIATPSSFFANSSAPATTPSVPSSAATPLPATSSGATASGCGGYGGSCEGTPVVGPTPPAAGVPSSGSPKPSSPGSPAPKPSSPSSPPVSPPDVLPKCMNTWLQIDSKCKNNADKACYCKNPEFTKNVIDCVTAWCGTDEETQKSLQYLVGICAEHIPENPKIIEDCPPYIPLNPAPPTGGVASTTSANVPAGETPAPQPPQPQVPEVPVTTVTHGSTVVTVPQVHFTTEPNVGGAVPTQPVGLVPGNTPPQTPAVTTASNGAPYPIASTFGTQTTPLATGTGAARPSSPPEFTGAAAPFKVVPAHALIGAALALFAL